jgi:hypothetical protein
MPDTAMDRAIESRVRRFLAVPSLGRTVLPRLSAAARKLGAAVPSAMALRLRQLRSALHAPRVGGESNAMEGVVGHSGGGDGDRRGVLGAGGSAAGDFGDDPRFFK